MGSIKWKCPVCHYSQVSSWHPSEKVDKKYECPNCGVEFKDSKYECPKCSFETSDDLRMHFHLEESHNYTRKSFYEEPAGLGGFEGERKILSPP